MKSHSKTIAGLEISEPICIKVNEKHNIPSIYTSEEPLTTISKSSKCDHTYTVNIMAHIPSELTSLKHLNLHSGFNLKVINAKQLKEDDFNAKDDKMLFLNYNGIESINTSIKKNQNNNSVICRSFNLIYDCENIIHKNYDLYHIKFDYKLTTTNQQSVEAVIVKLINEDPETSRGTVVTVKNDDN